MPVTAPAYIDHHCHGIVVDELDRRRLESLFSEAHRPHAGGGSQFDKPLGLMIRKHCAPVLDLEPLTAAEVYVERRLALGAPEVNRRLMRAAGMDLLLVDTGFRSNAITGHEELGRIAGCPAREVVRIEAVLEEAAGEAGGAEELLIRFDRLLEERAREAVGLKSIVAYRTSFAIDQSRPTPLETIAAASEWLGSIAASGRIRIEHPILIRHALFKALEVCRERRFPLQLHVGFGDRDVRMPQCDPTVFAPFIETAEAEKVPIALLHCWPFVREAGWLAEVFANVHFDVGAILNYTGPGARRIMREAMEMGPFHKQLYSSDAFGLAELHHLGRVLFDDALGRLLDDWIAEGDCTAADADRFMAMIAAGNARRIYRLEDA
ncbi:MAG: amidohydrolase family protein [Geminicoccaceae bacterium]